MPRVRSKEKRREYRLKAKYGITVDEYEQMLASQNGVCAICESPPPEGRRLAVDHCHESLRVRGLLCTTCNVGIGALLDDPNLMLAAAAYVISEGA